jgi:hypothetical protein
MKKTGFLIFGNSKTDNAKILLRDIVKNLYELSFRISIVEKYTMDISSEEIMS